MMKTIERLDELLVKLSDFYSESLNNYRKDLISIILSISLENNGARTIPFGTNLINVSIDDDAFISSRVATNKYSYKWDWDFNNTDLLYIFNDLFGVNGVDPRITDLLSRYAKGLVPKFYNDLFYIIKSLINKSDPITIKNILFINYFDPKYLGIEINT